MLCLHFLRAVVLPVFSGEFDVINYVFDSIVPHVTQVQHETDCDPGDTEPSKREPGSQVWLDLTKHDTEEAVLDQQFTNELYGERVARLMWVHNDQINHLQHMQQVDDNESNAAV